VTANRWAPLDGIRGIAILFVVAGHIAANYAPLDPVLRRWLVAFANAEAGVRLFFVLSGYLITTLLVREHLETGGISLKNFYYRRLLRIFPACYFYLAALVVFGFFRSTGVTPSSFTAAATFTWNYGFLWVSTEADGWWNFGHLWTLALEQQFYLLWPLVLIRVGLQRALTVALAIAVWSPIARVATYYLFPTQRGFVGAMLHTGMDSLMIGAAAALLLQREPWQQFLRSHARRGAAAAVIWLALLSPLAGEVRHGFPLVAGYTLDALAAAWLIACAHRTTIPGMARVLGSRALTWLGLISYSLYLWQQPFLSPRGPLQAGNFWWPLVCSFAVACFSYRVIEQPALRLKDRFTRVSWSKVPA
jgi:peptidoglycan/LPS O-acetylase OafA/YrhL